MVDETGSAQALALIDGASEIVAASIGYVEARAALARAARGGRLTRSGYARGRADLETLWGDANIVPLSDVLVTRAADIAEQSRVRAADAIHLASASLFDELDLVLATWDTELRRAAIESGLAVAP